MAEPLRLYLKDIKKLPLLSPEEELKLARLARKGNASARKKMIQSNLRLVVSIAKRYRHLGFPLIDLIEEGNLGLMKAIAKFKPNKGYKFSTYGSWWIRQYISRALATQAKIIRIPVYMVENILKYKKVTEELSHKLKRTPTASEVARKMRISADKVKQISGLLTEVASLESPIGEEDAGEFLDLIEDEAAASPVDELAQFLRQERVEKLLSRMKDREQKILRLRYGLEDGVAHTLSDTAKRFKITRERVRQIEQASLKKLRRYIDQQEGSEGH